MAQQETPFPDSVLVVDDEPAILQIFEALLPAAGMPTSVAPDGEKALALLEQKKFGAVLVDKNLPGIDGVEVIKAVRLKQPYCACLMMTAYSSTASAIAALQVGAKDYLEKPFQDLELVAFKIRNAISASRSAFERDQLANRIKEFEAELGQREKKPGELETLNLLVEQRVRQETDDLRSKCAMLESSLRSNQGMDLTVAMHTEALLEHLKSVSLESGTPIAVARGVLARVARQLESNLSMLRSAQRSAKKSERA
jgi:DNA-binding response OmpR family regulator